MARNIKYQNYKNSNKNLINLYSDNPSLFPPPLQNSLS